MSRAELANLCNSWCCRVEVGRDAGNEASSKLCGSGAAAGVGVAGMAEIGQQMAVEYWPAAVGRWVVVGAVILGQLVRGVWPASNWEWWEW